MLLIAMMIRMIIMIVMMIALMMMATASYIGAASFTNWFALIYMDLEQGFCVAML